jgi:hypothetical protein
MRAIDEIQRRAAAHAQRQCAEQKQRDGRVDAEETLSAEDGTDRASQLAPIRHPQQNLFLAQMFDAALKDDQASMEHPMFSLSKTPDLNIRVYEHNGNSITITPSANGLATIWDKDVLLFAISTLIEAQNRGIPTRVFLTETPESQFSDTSERARHHRSVCRVGSLDATSRLQLIDNLLDVDICVNVSKRVLAVEIHVLPTHRTDAFDLVNLLEVIPALLAFQKLR